MDRPLDDHVKTGRLLKRISIGGASLAALVLLLTLGPTWIAPSVVRSRVRTARVTTGAIDATISASGLVLPELERVISSPVDARVDRILRRIGDAVKAGDPILTLDTSETALAVEKITQTVALKANQQGQGALPLEKTLAGLDSRVRLETLKLEAARAQLARKRQLFKESLVSEEDLKLAEMVEAQAVIELRRPW